MARRLLKLHDKSGDWAFLWADDPRVNKEDQKLFSFMGGSVAGSCFYKDRVLIFDRGLVETTEDEGFIEHYMLHEVAHMLAGEKAGHGPKFVETCKQIGTSQWKTALDRDLYREMRGIIVTKVVETSRNLLWKFMRYPGFSQLVGHVA